MQRPLYVLLVEDSEVDKNLILQEFQKNETDFHYKQVETEKELRSALKKENWDLVLCNYTLSEFDALFALDIVRETNTNIPVIIISDARGEQVAVKAMRAGANDYILKSNMQRLVPSIEKELKEAKSRIWRRQAEEENNLLLKVVQQSTNEIYVVNNKTLQFEYVNPSALSNLGYSEEEIKDLTPYDINPDADKEYFQKTLSLLLDEKIGSIFFTTNHKRKDGSIYPVELNIQLIEQNGKRFAVSTGIDLTDRKKDASTIKNQKKLTEELAHANEYKSQFLANMSHELRTPLNSINLLSRLLLSNRPGNLNKEQLDYLDVIHKSGNNLLELINEILDFSQVEAGEITIQLEKISVEKVFSSLEMLFSPIAKERELQFSVKNKTVLEKPLFIDSLRLEQILKNLLSNAFKFTDKGTVELSAFTPEADKIDVIENPSEWIAFQVSDTGIGIPDDKHKLIFEAFQQTDHSTQRIYGGTGLGLSICRELTTLLGGTLTLESEEGSGSTFTLYLPVDTSKVIDKSMYRVKEQKDIVSDILSFTDNKPLLKHPAQNKNGSNIKKLLLVDDSEIHVSALKELLETSDRKCIVAGSAQETMEILNSVHIDCLVLDLGLPDANGFDVIKQIKAEQEIKHIPIIVYTGKSLSRAEERQLNEVVAAVIIKTSNNFKKLNEAIDRLLEIGEIQPTHDTHKDGRLKDKKILIVDDDRWNVYSLSLVLKEFEMESLSASNGMEAIKVLEETPDVDIVLMDIMMPIMDGYKTVKKIRKSERFRELPVIAVTSKTVDNEREKCLEMGFSNYLSKPIIIQDLVDLLYEMLN